MATTRNFISLGVWAEDAQTIIPSEPTPGIAYRNTALTEQDNEDGEEFQTKANSADINQKMFVISSFTDMINTNGVPGWSDQVSYDVPAIVWADDGNFYLASGPSLGADPVTSPNDWDLLDDTQAVLDLLANETPGSEGDRLVGHTNETVFTAITNLQSFEALLQTNAGASQIGTTSGLTVQQVLDSLTNEYPTLLACAKTTSVTGSVSFVGAKNIASIQQQAVGVYRVTFTTPLPDTTGIATGTLISGGTGGPFFNFISTSQVDVNIVGAPVPGVTFEFSIIAP